MSNPLFEYTMTDFHSAYMACAQEVNWCPEVVANKTKATGFIVQEIHHQRIVDSVEDYTVRYFEAWEIKDGICYKDKGQDCDDRFSVGYPSNMLDAMRDSIGHRGTVYFHPKVFWVDIESAAFYEVNSWDNTTVKEANGLKAAFYSDLIKNTLSNEPQYERDSFIHEWNFSEPMKICNEALSYCRRMYDPNTLIGRKNFEICIEELFPEKSYLDIRSKVQEEWGYTVQR